MAIVDVRLPPTFTDEGIRAALAARREVPGLPVLVLSQYVDGIARELLAGGRQATCSRTGCSTAPLVDLLSTGSPTARAPYPEVIARLARSLTPATAAWPRSARANARCSR